MGPRIIAGNRLVLARRGGADSGFAYLTVLFLVALIGVSLAAAGTLWHIAQQREKEKELLFVGDQFRQAIGRYYQRTPGAVKKYPPTLNDLLKDKRYLTTQRYLRKRYVDPMTGTTRWGLVRAPDGGILGVYSLSNATPLKVGNFKGQDAAFTGKRHYSGWTFIYLPPTP